MKWIIEMPDGWKPEPVDDGRAGEKCVACPFQMAFNEGEGDSADSSTYFCFPGRCPLAKAVEVK